MKYIFGVVGIVIIGGVLYYALSPLFKNKEVNDPLPEAAEEELSEVPSGVENLTLEEQAAMETQTAVKNAEGPIVIEDEMPSSMDEGQTMAQTVSGAEVRGSAGHPASGTARVIETAQGVVIRYENFKTINGPRLHVYLSKDLEGSEFIDLGPIKGTEGNINYEVPEGTDLSEYRYVLHWCVPFRVLFNYADISTTR